MMSFTPVLETVEMELLIEGSRKEIFAKVTGGGYKSRDELS